MVLNDITNHAPPTRTNSTTSVHIRLPVEFAPKGTRVNDHRSLLQRRAEGDTNVDLWVDGHLYPSDPMHSYHPTFNNLSTFLQFVGRGETGLLGYCKRLSMHANDNLQWWIHQCQGLQQHIMSQQNNLASLESEVATLKEEMEKKDANISKLGNIITQLKRTPLGARQRKRPFASVEALAHRGGARKRRVMATRYLTVFTCFSYRVYLLGVSKSI